MQEGFNLTFPHSFRCRRSTFVVELPSYIGGDIGKVWFRVPFSQYRLGSVLELRMRHRQCPIRCFTIDGY